MSLRVVVRPSAETDLLESAMFIAEDDPTAAQRFLHEAEKAFARVAEFPEIGTPRGAFDPSLEGYGGSPARLGRALDRLGYRKFRRHYSDKEFLTTHTTLFTTTIRYGDGSETRVTTSGTQEPLAVWTAKRLVMSHMRGAAWETQTTSSACSMVR